VSSDAEPQRAGSRKTLDKIAAALTAVDAEHSVTVGVADADRADSLRDLIARADADVLEARRNDEWLARSRPCVVTPTPAPV